MPYRSGMRVTVTATDFFFYHVTYRTFAGADGVRTFDPSDRATDVIAMLRRAGAADPKHRVRPAAQRTRSTRARIPPGERMTLASLRGPGVIDELRIRVPEIVGADQPPSFDDDGRGFHDGGGSEFTVAIDPDNEGVRLTRRLDTTWPATQVATVSVDGEVVGEWQSFPGRQGNQWADAVLDLPAELTRGKSRLVVTTTWKASILNSFEEFTYWVDSLVDGEYRRTDMLDVGPDSTDSEQRHSYRIDGERWQGRRWAAYAPTGDRDAIALSDLLLESLRLRISFDGETTVDSPLGEFFGAGVGEYDVTSLFLSVDSAPGGWYTSWWPMPFATSAVVELVNDSDETVALAESEVSWQRRRGPVASPVGGSVGGAVGGSVGASGAGYFHATSHRGHTVDGEDWTFLDVTGRGKIVGVSHTMIGEAKRGDIGSRTYLEGDERVWIDGENFPSIHGTGTEDFYEGGWYFRAGPFSNPLNGSPGYEIEDMGCLFSCTSAYRLFIGDAVPFADHVRFDIEHGGDNTWPAVYGSTAFWYDEQT
jgi:hypothetical protein